VHIDKEILYSASLESYRAHEEMSSVGSVNAVTSTIPNPSSFLDGSENLPIKIGWRNMLELGLSIALAKWFEREGARLNHQQYGQSA